MNIKHTLALTNKIRLCTAYTE